MENCIHEDELRRLRSLVVKLAKELDYKNFKLIELEEKNALELQNWMKDKEKSRSERSAAISVLVSENVDKEILLDQMSARINSLKQEKEQMLFKTTGSMNALKEDNERLMNEKSAYIDTIVKLKTTKDKLANENERLGNEWKHELKDSKLKLESVEDLRTEINNLRKEVQESAELLENLEMNNQFLTVKEIKSNHELQATRKAAIEGLLAMQSLKMSVGIKIMGEIKHKSFRDACSKRFRSGKWESKFGRWEEKSVELCAAWQNNISDPEWQPFKREIIDEKLTEVIDENDQRLKELKEEWGDEAYTAVVEALLQVNEYNASGRYPVAELWNYKENRKASLDEVMKYVIKQWRTHKKRKFFA